MKIYLKKILLFSIVILFFYLLYFNLRRPFGWDELEHIHSAFLISQGKIPYRDFFQHHHPLLWYIYSPIFLLFGESISTLIAIKILSFVIGVINIFLLYFVCKVFIKDFVWRVLSIVIFTSSIAFLLNGMEMRPDNLMMLFVLLSFNFLQLFFEKATIKFLIISGFSLGISFLFLQKSLFFFVIFNIVLLIFYLKNTNISTSKKLRKWLLSAVVFNLFIVIPIIIFLLLLIKNNLFQQYYFFNWTLNFNFDEKFVFLKTLQELNFLYVLFFIFYSFSFLIITATLIKQYKKLFIDEENFKVLILFLCNILVCAFLFTVRSPYMQYFLPLTFFGAVQIILAFKNISEQFRILRLAILFLLLPLVYPPFPFSREYLFSQQLHEIVTVQRLSESEKKNMRVQHEKNIFAHDENYYWFSPEAQKTIRSLDAAGEVPENIPRVEKE